MYFLAPEGMERLSASLKVALRNGHVPKNAHTEGPCAGFGEILYGTGSAFYEGLFRFCCIRNSMCAPTYTLD